MADGHTYAGNPVACAIGLEAIRQTVEADLPENARVRGERARRRLEARARELPQIGDVRGEGLLVGIEFVADREARAPFPAKLDVGVEVRKLARSRGLLLRASHWFVVFAPPLVTTADELDAMLDILEASIRDVLAAVARRTLVEETRQVAG